MLRKLMKLRDINGAQLGRRVGVSRSLVSMWIRGKSVPRTPYLPKIAEVLNVSVEDIVNCFK